MKFKLLGESAIRKKHGDSVRGDILLPTEKTLWLPSRVLPLNWQLGGGLQYGKIAELFGYESTGKSLLGLDFGYVAQSLGGVLLWGDAESSFNPGWATRNGLDPKRIEVYDSNDIEGLSDWVMDWIIFWRSKLTKNEPILFVLDSIATLDCLVNINSSQRDAKAEMGNRAKAIYKMLRTRNHMFKKLGVTVLLINQVRKKVGASMFEASTCLHGDSLVLTNIGSLPISKIVENKLKVKVNSYNPRRKSFEFKKVSGWIKKEVDEKWISIITNGPESGGGNFGIVCTETHGVLTQFGWRYARFLNSKKDKVLTSYPSIINGTVEEFMVGSFIGDSSLRRRTKNTAIYRLRDSNNKAYVIWKKQKLEPFIMMHSHNEGYICEASVELSEFERIYKGRNINAAFNRYGGKLPVLSLAIWYMDDGHLGRVDSCPQGSISWSRPSVNTERIKEFMCYMGFECNVRMGGKGILFTVKGLDAFCKKIRHLIPDSMQYKLPKEHRGYYKDFKLNAKKDEIGLWVNIISIKEAGKRNYRKNWKYDLTVNGNHNFMAGGISNGFIVHNTQPGGDAVKFYASQRIGLIASKQIKGIITKKGFRDDPKGKKMGRNIIIQIEKNKLAPPTNSVKTQVYFQPDIWNHLGYSRYHGLLDILVEEGTVEKRGNWYYYGDHSICQGEEAFIELMHSEEKKRKILLKASSINTISKTRDKLKALDENFYPIKSKAYKDEEDDQLE